ncbi:MAG: SDR family oxidoreductase [Chloroflexi bacterium]|nr:SDR family oxidoreductase [Chloroflexota bacterium]
MERLEEYYRDKVVLLTGGTGLVGKVMIETFLRRLRDVRRIYVLVRPKTRPGGQAISCEDRLLQEVLDSQAFDPLREQLGGSLLELFQEKVHAVSGDLSLDDMGLDPETYRRLQREVQVIINCAATVSFDAPIDAAIELNTLGPKRIIDFARGGIDPVIAQISTCYVNATRKGPIPEEALDPRRTVGHMNGLRQRPYDVEEEVDAILTQARALRDASSPGRRRGQPSEPQGKEAPSRAELERVERRISEMGMKRAHSRGWHDIYTFTKAMGEQNFVRHKGDVRGVIIRPAIIEGAWRTPAPGWLNGFRMLDPLIVAYGRGRMIDFPGYRTGILDIIPVDMVVNATLAIIAWTEHKPGHTVYQIASGMENPLTLQGFADQVDQYFRKHPLNDSSGENGKDVRLRMPTFPSTRRFLRRIKYRYILPVKALIVLATALSFIPGPRRLKAGYKVKLLALERLYQYGRLYGPYAEADCQFLTNNTREVWESLAEEDRDVFDFDIARMDWTHYLQDVYIPGVKRYLLGMTEEEPAPITDGAREPSAASTARTSR